MNPFQSIPEQNQINLTLNLNLNKEKKKEMKINKNINYEQSQVLLHGISQVVICGICEEEFSKTNKEYNAQKDDWILKNACYADGTCSILNGENKGKQKQIVHRKCWELKKKQTIQNNKDKELIPKLFNKNSTISKIEEHFNEKVEIKKTKKRKINHLFAVSDDDQDEEIKQEQQQNQNKNKHKDQKNKNEEEDLEGIGIEDIVENEQNQQNEEKNEEKKMMKK